MIDPRPDDTTPLGDTIVEYNGVPTAIKDIPDRFTRVMLGYGHDNPYGRRVVPVEGRVWESTPDTCTYGSLRWEWITAEGKPGETQKWPVAGLQYLVCPQCGLDGT